MNITLEYRPVKTPNYGGFIESIWDTINDAIRDFPLPGRVYPPPKSKDVTKRKYRIPKDYNPKEKAGLTLDAFDKWFFHYIVTTYNSTPRAKQIHSPSKTWEDGLDGSNHQPMGGSLRVARPDEMETLEFNAKQPFNATLSRHGFRYKNILFTSNWLKKARRDKVLKDKKSYDLRISHWDVRHAYIVNPETREIETLTAYKYDGDRRAHDFLLQGVGTIQDKEPYPVTLNELKAVKKAVPPPDDKKEAQRNAVSLMNHQIEETSKRNKQQRKFLDKLARDPEGRELLSQAEIIAQIRSNQESMTNSPENFDEVEQVPRTSREPVEAFPTDWDSVPDDMKLGHSR